MFLGEELYKFYTSFDSFKDETRNLYQQEFLDSISLRGLPQHRLILKERIICYADIEY